MGNSAPERSRGSLGTLILLVISYAQDKCNRICRICRHFKQIHT